MVGDRGRARLLAYPAEELDEIWRSVLLHQFHDILPGSSIAWVHRRRGRRTPTWPRGWRR